MCSRNKLEEEHRQQIQRRLAKAAKAAKGNKGQQRAAKGSKGQQRAAKKGSRGCKGQQRATEQWPAVFCGIRARNNV